MIKRMVRGGVAVVCAAVLLVGCQRQPTDSSPSSDRKALENAGQALTVVTSAEGKLVPGCSTAKGFYEVISASQGKNICYTDYASATRMVLCSRPECGHSDETCTGFLSETQAEFAGLFIWNNKLMVNYAAPLYKIPSTLIQMDLDGSNAKTVHVFAPNELANDPVVADKSSLYFVVDAIAEENNIPSLKKQLVKLEIESGKKQVLYTLAPNETLIGAVSNAFILRNSVSDFSFTASKLSLSGELQELDLAWNAAEQKSFCENGTIYFIDNTLSELTGYDFHTEKSIRVPLPMPLKGRFDTGFIESVHEHRVLFLYEDDEALWQQVGIDAVTGSLKSVALRGLDLYQKPTRPMHVIAETAEAFLVETGTLAASDSKRALIAKKDFWDSSPSYRYIEDTDAFGNP